ncbi:hypothetical protein P8785_07550, partial [Bacillus subtilis]|uniref:hypothetical protein n=1 Tax=Bacillus subtilis TaxID=1423 RepID=UPI002DBBFA73
MPREIHGHRRAVRADRWRTPGAFLCPGRFRTGAAVRGDRSQTPGVCRPCVQLQEERAPAAEG